MSTDFYGLDPTTTAMIDNPDLLAEKEKRRLMKVVNQAFVTDTRRQCRREMRVFSILSFRSGAWRRPKTLACCRSMDSSTII